ncbi:carbamoyltransferase C-terminal domain-containing protein [Sorangium sp. So ce327]|jgi:carbamoyltransferase|uniref:carbamoyltransferase family protein n=1 Tax=Sorangium sp. So ce327 TaxID=3133301 RepID=UPI003F6455A4
MRILGISGGHEPDQLGYPRPVFNAATSHDGAAVLLEDGEVVAAIEQERLNRLKHSNKAPFQAVRFCLESRGLRVDDVDYLCFYISEDWCDAQVKRGLFSADPELRTANDVMRRLVLAEFGVDVRPECIQFVKHHTAHAMSALIGSGYESSLVLTLDGCGDGESGSVSVGSGGALHSLRDIPERDSLGNFYVQVIRFLGFSLFDEYKVMGLAPYGDPRKFRALFQAMFTLLPEGAWAVDFDKIVDLHGAIRPRAPREPITQDHKDIAASLQEALETIVFHCLRHFQRETRQASLCFAGGVAHNCTLNGKILRSGLFERVFVQPAAHDAGCALGAAMAVHTRKAPGRRPPAMDHLYWGRHIGEQGEIRSALDAWRDFIRVEELADAPEAAAELIAAGSVIGWAQGRSEFGPRALGNRSILADPRPAANKDLINAMVKKREEFRPFAPAVTEEDARDYFDLGGAEAMPFMIFTVPVHEQKRQQLGAVTHVDGTARVQTVSRRTNPRFWQLIRAFGDLTGVPVVLNTSFNNNAEPIVDSVDDCVTCFLTTRLDKLVVGDHLVHKTPAPLSAYAELVPSFPTFVKLLSLRGPTPGGHEVERAIVTTYNDARTPVSAETFEVLWRADGRKRLRELLDGVEDREAVIAELIELWSQRVVRLLPATGH